MTITLVRKALHNATLLLAAIGCGSLGAALIYPGGAFHSGCLVALVFSALLLVLLVAAGGLHAAE